MANKKVLKLNLEELRVRADPLAFWEFVPDIRSMETDRCFFVFSLDSGDSKQTGPRPPQRSGRSIMEQQIMYFDPKPFLLRDHYSCRAYLKHGHVLSSLSEI